MFYLGIGLVTIGNRVFSLHQLFGLFNHLSSETSDALNKKQLQDKQENSWSLNKSHSTVISVISVDSFCFNHHTAGSVTISKPSATEAENYTWCRSCTLTKIRLFISSNKASKVIRYLQPFVEGSRCR